MSAASRRRLVRAEQVLARRTRRISLLLEGSQDPHNVHAVLRTAEAFGVQDVHLVATRGDASAISPGVTQRAHEWLTVRRHADREHALEALRAEGREVWATANRADAEPLAGIQLPQRVAVVLGNESEGVSPELVAAADRVVRIDLVGFSGSVNLSVAAAVVLWELRRGSLDGDLDAAELSELRIRWYSALLGRPASDPVVVEWLARAGELAGEAASSPILPAPERSSP